MKINHILFFYVNYLWYISSIIIINKTKQMKNQDKMYDELVDLRDQLEQNESENEDMLESIFFILDSMRGGYDMTEEAEAILNQVK